MFPPVLTNKKFLEQKLAIFSLFSADELRCKETTYNFAIVLSIWVFIVLGVYKFEAKQSLKKDFAWGQTPALLQLDSCASHPSSIPVLTG